MTYLAGIDLGSTTLKAGIYDLAGNVVASACRPTEQVHPGSAPRVDRVDARPDPGTATTTMKKAVAQLDQLMRIKGVAVTGMGMDGVPVDGAGQWLYPFIQLALSPHAAIVRLMVRSHHSG
ncbi:MAG: FGGY family carbohydrate kinase [Caldilineales bacterium]